MSPLARRMTPGPGPLREEADGCTVEVELSWRGDGGNPPAGRPLTGDEFQREGLRRRAIGRCFFLAAHGVTGTAPPGGCSPACAR